MDILTAILIGWLAVTLMMGALWIVQQIHRDAGVVDVGWAAGLGLLALWYAWMGDGDAVRRLIIALMAGFWAFRLAGYLLFDRVIGKSEDGRYVELREHWGKSAGWKFFVFFQAQGVLDVVLATPFLLVAYHQAENLHWLEWLAVVLWLTAVAGESIADRQLARFRADPANRGQTCRRGLWRVSRHPNYFFEWLIWCAYALMALPAPYGWIALACPALMLLLILKVTGIPPTEARALKTRGDDYRRYQRTTSKFFPWFPRKESVQ